VYNSERYLRECVDSVLAQEGFEDCELLLIDDSSKDGSFALCEAYAAKNPRVKALRQPNGGVSSVRNAGIRLAQGEFVLFVDSDDWLRPGMLKALLPLAREAKADICRCSGQRFLDGTELWQPVASSGEAKRYAQTRGSQFAELLNRLPDPEVVWGALYRRSFLLEKKLFFDERLRLCEDLPFAYSALALAGSVVQLESPFYCYRVRRDSRSQAASDPATAARLALILEPWERLRSELGGNYPAALMAAKSIDMLCALQAQVPKTARTAFFQACRPAMEAALERAGRERLASSPPRLYRSLAAAAFLLGKPWLWNAAATWRNALGWLNRKRRSFKKGNAFEPACQESK
jgi:hypothetical protein